MLGVLPVRLKSHAHWMVVQVVKECETGDESEGKTFETLDSVDIVILDKSLNNVF